MSKNNLKIIVNILFVVGWLMILGTIIFSILMKDNLDAYNLGRILITITIINLCALIFIFIKPIGHKFLDC
ncbi:hypothetical protein GC105_11385 [Alkalibaculum sp. M08DMB]|uniref:Uncharacterized protein n=1 Tax=Alkalibaculum sporogenes TaxID=2655001 RepID=A0A6A7KAT3_9FIRM|nr:hypothetical protein [Alkalibaculum sporogenes]MPW26391.1 hypothetical protein [Alkalibaculum sporogenes]